MAKTQTQKKTLRPPTLTRTQLLDKLRNQKGATFATIIARTEPKMRKTDNRFWGKVWKISRVNGTLNFIYGNSVNRQRVREGKVADFQPEPRRWGERLTGTTLVEHKGEFYAEMKVENFLGREFVWKSGPALTDAEVEELKTFLSESKQPETQQTDKEIVLRDYMLRNIASITMDGTQFVVVRS